MEETLNQTSNFKIRKWYNSFEFPLIPEFNYTPKDNFKTAKIKFYWLFIKIWSLDSFSFEIAFNVSTHWGIGFTFCLPYLRIIFCIPCTNKIAFFIEKHLDRRPKTI